MTNFYDLHMAEINKIAKKVSKACGSCRILKHEYHPIEGSCMVELLATKPDGERYVETFWIDTTRFSSEEYAKSLAYWDAVLAITLKQQPLESLLELFQPEEGGL